jgi:hypothetical protein
VAVVGEVVPDLAPDLAPGVGDGLEVVSLVEAFGDARARGDTLACIEQVIAGVLAEGHARGVGR